MRSTEYHSGHPYLRSVDRSVDNSLKCEGRHFCARRLRLSPAVPTLGLVHAIDKFTQYLGYKKKRHL